MMASASSCAELAGDAVRRATAEQATRAPSCGPWRSSSALACLARRGRAAARRATRSRTAAPLRVPGGRAARRGPGLCAAAEASSVARALGADLKNAPKLAEALAPRLRGAARGALAQRVLLKRDTKAARAHAPGGRAARADLQAKDARVLASAASKRLRGARRRLGAAGPPAAWCAALASSAARAGQPYRSDARLLLGARSTSRGAVHQSTRPWRRGPRGSRVQRAVLAAGRRAAGARLGAVPSASSGPRARPCPRTRRRRLRYSMR